MYFRQSKLPDVLYSQTCNDINEREGGEREEWREGGKERGTEGEMKGRTGIDPGGGGGGLGG